MDPQQRLQEVAARLEAAGYAVTPSVDVEGTTALVGHTSTFRWRWMATRMHLLVYAQAVEAVTIDGLERFSFAALEDALAAKGRLRGLQVGVAVAPVQIGARVEPGARRYAQHEIMRRYGAFAWPVAVDAASGAVSRHVGRPAIGAIYTSWLRGQIDAVTAGHPQGPAGRDLSRR